MNVKKDVISNLSTAFNHIEDVYNKFKFLLKNESSLNEVDRNKLYEYGLDQIKIDLVRLVNIKKGLLAIIKKPIIEEIQ